MPVTSILGMVAGLIILVAGAELLVRGASRLATAAGISPLIVGLTVVALGTSSPEVAVTLGSAFSGQADLAVGNVIGSNIFNVLFVLGLAAAIAPLIVAQHLVRVDVPVMIGVSLLLVLFAQNGAISRLEGVILVAGALGYTAFAIYAGRRESPAVEQEYRQEFGPSGDRSVRGVLRNLLLVAVGLAALVFGARLLVNGAVAIARVLGVSELIIGLTIVAAGTSLPEVATSVLASLRGERDIAAGNVVGSNIYNILLVLGLAAVLAPAGLAVAPSALTFDLPFLLAVAIACLPLFFTGYRIARWEGFLFLGYYIAYTAYLLLAATEHDALPAFSVIMFEFVAPLTAITLAVIFVRALRSNRARG